MENKQPSANEQNKEFLNTIKKSNRLNEKLPHFIGNRKMRRQMQALIRKKTNAR